VGVVRRRSWPAHALSKTEPLQPAYKAPTAVLAATVAVEDQPFLRPPEPEGLVKGRACEVRATMRGQAPADHASRALIDDDGEIPPPPGDRQVGDVGDPYPVRMPRTALPDTVWMLGVEVVDTRVRTVDSGAPRSKAGRSHQARYAPPARVGPASSQRLM